ncbi:ATP-binding protein [Actinoallomurus soli]|uniref:ATP-binding protein n=1 Tax=Actinoallomurus soli TaxID=2952535 RepID=UPI00209346F3|nr:ATP-binding protein [Actinoallomurus soli]MCO5970356.1 ATP-binding protein [Actinoallomurus soli]
MHQYQRTAVRPRTFWTQSKGSRLLRRGAVNFYGPGRLVRRRAYRSGRPQRPGVGGVNPITESNAPGRVSWSLPSSPPSVARARHLTADQLAGWGFAEHRETAELLISELITNALQHGVGPIRLNIRFLGGVLRFEVADAGPRYPRMRPVDDEDEGGRGLHLVESLSSRWGYARATIGKVVWFELPAA